MMARKSSPLMMAPYSMLAEQMARGFFSGIVFDLQQV
jgi:hypothetical protein